MRPLPFALCVVAMTVVALWSTPDSDVSALPSTGPEVVAAALN